MANYIPHNEADLERMLTDLGLSSLDELFAMIPDALRLARPLAMADGLSEVDMVGEFERLAGANLLGDANKPLLCFAGAGAYDHDVASIVRRVGMRGEFVTAYTPYQAEISQGVLQALFEYQTIVSRLFGLPVANASLYDGATALVEAINLCVASSSNSCVYLSDGVNPRWREVVCTLAAGSGHEIVCVPLVKGKTDWRAVSGNTPGVIVVAYPNYLGVIEDLASAQAFSETSNAKMVVCADPVSLGLLKSPGIYGASVVVGEGQPFGTPLSFGGPYLGLFAVADKEIRRIPGRLVGETRDLDDNVAYVTTLRAREQDIRREKASSNVCTNQTLIAVAFLIQLSWLGTTGLREMALQCARGTKYLRDRLATTDGVSLLNDSPTLREFAFTTDIAADTVLERMAEHGVLGGVALNAEFGAENNGVLVAVTEKRTRCEIDLYVETLEKVLR